MAGTIDVSEEIIRSVLKPRNPESRKGENGVVAVVGGSRLYHGAPFLSASAALRAGVDLVYLCVPQSIATAVRALSPNLIVIPRPDVKLTVGAANKIFKWLPKVDAIVLGPGLGRQRTDGACKLTRELASDGTRVVLDADGLRSDIVSTLRNREAVITPHAGEFRRLFEIDLESSLDFRVEKVREMSRKIGVTILLKGKVDVISDGERIALNHTGSPAMTTGGTGDVLAGIVAGLLAKNVEPFLAASIAAYINGYAGEKAASRRGMHIVASDLIDEIPEIMMKIESSS